MKRRTISKIELASDTDAYKCRFYGSTATRSGDVTMAVQGHLLYYGLHHASL